MICGRHTVIRLAGMAALAGVSGLLVSACASGATAPSAAATLATISTPADPLASLSADQVLLKTLANIKTASTVQMTGTFSDSGTNYTLDLGLKPGHGCSGTIAMGSQGSFKLVVIGKTVYFNPDDKFWKAQAGATDAATVIGVIRERYIKSSTTDKDMASFTSLCDVSKTIGSVTGSGSGTDTKGKPVTLDGARVLPLTDSSGDLVDVTDTSRPELVTISVPKDGTTGATKLDFAVGAPVTLTAPPASQVIDGSQVGM
jgi:hypothetical protein